MIFKHEILLLCSKFPKKQLEVLNKKINHITKNVELYYSKMKNNSDKSGLFQIVIGVK